MSQPDLCRAAVDIGRGHGFKVVATLQPDDALVVAHQRGPDAAIVGMDMVTHDGASLLHGLKRHPQTRLIPTVVTHAAEAAEDAHQGRLSGALDVIEEPVTRPKLDGVLERLDAFLNTGHRRLLVVTEQADGDAVAIADRLSPLEALDVDVVGSAVDADGGARRRRLRLRRGRPRRQRRRRVRGAEAAPVAQGAAEHTRRDHVRGCR